MFENEKYVISLATGEAECEFVLFLFLQVVSICSAPGRSPMVVSVVYTTPGRGRPDYCNYIHEIFNPIHGFLNGIHRPTFPKMTASLL